MTSKVQPAAELTAVKRKSMRNALVPGRRPRKSVLSEKKIERQWLICLSEAKYCKQRVLDLTVDS